MRGGPLLLIRSCAPRCHVWCDRLNLADIAGYLQVRKPRPVMLLKPAQKIRFSDYQCINPLHGSVFVAALGRDYRALGSFYRLNVRKAHVLVHRKENIFFLVAVPNYTGIRNAGIKLGFFREIVCEAHYGEIGRDQFVAALYPKSLFEK